MSDKRFNNKNLKDAINKSGMTREQIAESVGCDTSSITKYYNGDRYPKTDIIIKLAELFNCSTDYLLGVSNIATADKDIQFICEYTGLSEQSIKSIRKLCIPDFSTIIFDEDEEDYNSEKNWLIKESQINKRSINAFISSNSFEYLIEQASDLTELNTDVLSYLSLYFNDFEYFDNLRNTDSDYDTVTKMNLFDNKYQYDAIHSGFQDRQDLIIFNIQRCIVSYFENFSNVLFIINDKDLTNTFDWLKYVVYDAIKTAFKDNKNVNTFINRVSEYGIPDDFNEDIAKLKEIFERMKINE